MGCVPIYYLETWTTEVNGEQIHPADGDYRSLDFIGLWRVG
jgi:hypothetical protein